MTFPRSLRCFIILNANGATILLYSLHFILFFLERQIGNTTCTDEDQDGKREKENTFFEIRYLRIEQITPYLKPEIFRKHFLKFFLGRLFYL